jgi:ectoine hydroxylase-related dioxygenase (phytanoyl-CoA dioxygenase family)
MIAIQKDTHLILYPGSHTWVRTEGPQRSTGMTIKLNRGDLVAWRGDLVHHGAPYKTSNIRIFLEARLPGHKEELNRSNDGTGKVVYRNYPVPWVEEPLSPEAASDEEKKAIETGQAIEDAEDVD